MRLLIPTFLGLVMLTGAADAALAQVGADADLFRRQVERAILITPAPVTPPPPRPVFSLARPEQVAERVLSFDLDGDSRIIRDELPDRMQSLVDRIDVNKDGFLDSVEIRSSVETRFSFQRSASVLQQGMAQGLGGVVSDLKLPRAKHDQAMAIAARHTVSRNVNDPASVDLYAKMRELLDDEEYENFVAAARRLSFARPGVVAAAGQLRDVAEAVRERAVGVVK